MPDIQITQEDADRANLEEANADRERLHQRVVLMRAVGNRLERTNEALEARVAQLESENAALREQLPQAPEPEEPHDTLAQGHFDEGNGVADDDGMPVRD